jgi:hypothetical protein
MRQEVWRGLRLSAAMTLVLAGAVALQVSYARGTGSFGGCGGTPSPHSVGVAVDAAAGMLTVTQERVYACPGDTVSWSKQNSPDVNTYTITFSSDADPCGWGGASQSLPVTCTIPSSGAPSSGSDFKYTVACSGKGCAAASALDPHIIIM